MSQRPPFDTGGVDVSRRGRRIETWACVTLGVLVGLFYLWSTQQPGGSWSVLTVKPSGYYPLQTAGFRSGHLYAAVSPQPALLSLKDPYDPGANTPYRVHDMSLYRGHYYLYYGVTPILILFWPVAAVTGRYVAEPFAVGLFCSAAVWVGMGLLLSIRRRHFPAAPRLVLLLAWLCLAWATPLVLLAENPRVYEVPISCAVFLQTLMLAALYRALHSEHRSLVWVAVCGLAFGLSIGARPNYLGGFVVLLVAAISLARSGRRAGARGGRRLASALLCAFSPPAVFGAGLLLYNWARFGSPAEFGIHYQLAAERVTQLQAMAPRFLLPHAAYYLFNPGHWDSYFPFFSAPAGQAYGFLRYVPWAWLMAAAFLWPGQGNPAERVGRSAIILAIACAFLANLALLACFFGTTYRYPGDFANAGLILAGVGSLSWGQRAAVGGRAKIAGWAMSAMGAASLFICAAVFIGSFPNKEMLLGVSRVANAPGFELQKARGGDFGGIRLLLELPRNHMGLPEPILETGREIDRRDCLGISYLPGNRAQLSFVHAGSAAIVGPAFDIPADRDVALEARFGSLLPPYGHPAFSGWTREGYEAVKRNLRVTVNGSDELRASLDCYEASPLSTRVGRSGWVTDEMQRAFTGSVERLERLPLFRPPHEAPMAADPEPVAISLYLAPEHHASSDPLVLTGKGKSSDLLYCVCDGENHVRFALDHFGAGGPQSETAPYDPLIPHTLTVWMGSMSPGAAASRGALEPDRLGVVFDGRTLLNIHQSFYPDAAEPPRIGLNPFGSSGAGPEFTGEILQAGRAADSALSRVGMNGGYGRVEMSVRFPSGVVGTQEPLAVTGVSRAGDFVYVRYVDAGHVAVGFDHWGIGGLMGNPVEVDYAQVHRIAITIQSLYPEGSAGHSSDAVRVLVDGRPALVGIFPCYPSRADQVYVGTNRIGGSTCGQVFTGNILSIGRFTEPSG
jgi:hypothetical protein